MVYFICFILFALPIRLLFPTIVRGRKNLKRKGKVILACNHQSNADAFIIASCLYKRRFKFMAKKEIFEGNKFIAWLMRKFGAYPINRGANDITAIKTTFKYLNEGKAVCMFPEGTRVTSEFGGEVKTGLAMIALKTKTPIVPCIQVKKPKLFRLNKMIVGEAFNLSEMDEYKDKKVDKELIEKATEYITERFNMLREQSKQKRKNKENANDRY